MRGRKRDRRLDEAILDEAGAAVARDGYHGFAVDTVAAQVGVPRSTVYARWTSRSDLIDGAIARVFDQPAVAVTDDLHADIRGSIADDLALVASPAGRAAVQLLLAASERDGPAAARLVRQVGQRRADYLTRLASDGIRGTGAQRHVDLVLTTIWGSAIPIGATTRPDPDELTAMILDELPEPPTLHPAP